ncbi:MAG TPA: endo-1,4-beta-xylanase [Gemmataceae bacterium]|nr:endo-1,4-beta-xylanase [Gemmataceae bacterium]
MPKTLPQPAPQLLEQACFAGGYDQTPVPTLAEIEGDRLYVSRAMSESGYLLVPWPVESFGTFVTTTSTLRERPEPYPLMVELARGKLNQVRMQTADWQSLGLKTPPEFDRELDEVTRLFGRAALDQPSPESDAVAARVLERSYDLADRLARIYTEQMIATRLHEEGRLATHLAARFSQAPTGELAADYRRAFNAAQMSFRWRDVEPVESEYAWAVTDEAVNFARAAGLPITAGPLIDISPGMLPNWAAGWQGDLPTLAAFMCDYLETVIGRYKADIRRWVVCAGFNHTDGLGLSDDDRLRLAARLFESAAHLDPELDLVLGIAQPWGDYLVHDEQTISPLAFADDLIRAGLRVSAVELEIRNGTAPRGSLPRDLLDTSRLLDLFAGMLGLPLEVVLGYPAGTAPDPAAEEHKEGLSPAGSTSGLTAEGQSQWGASFAALALCKPQVRAVTWDHWTDADPHAIPNGGLVAANGHTNPLLGRLRGLRTAILR